MNKLGVHMLVYGNRPGSTAGPSVFERAAAAGFDFVEVLIADPASADPEKTAHQAEAAGVGVVAALCGTLDANLVSADSDVARRGEAWVAAALPVARDMGATMLAGPTFGPLHRYAEPAPADLPSLLTSRYGRLAARAEEVGVRLGMEALNRYESNALNRIGDVADVVRTVGSSHLFTHADVFHMNIEEGDIGQAVCAAGETIGYVHVTESNRGRLGTGNFGWDVFFAALADTGYSGPITFESFSPENLDDDIVDMLALWRNPWTDADEVSRDAARFLRDHLGSLRH